MNGIPQEQQQAPSEPKKDTLLEEFEFGVGGILSCETPIYALDKKLSKL